MGAHIELYAFWGGTNSILNTRSTFSLVISHFIFESMAKFTFFCFVFAATFFSRQLYFLLLPVIFCEKYSRFLHIV